MSLEEPSNPTMPMLQRLGELFRLVEHVAMILAATPAAKLLMVGPSTYYAPAGHVTSRDSADTPSTMVDAPELAQPRSRRREPGAKGMLPSPT